MAAPNYQSLSNAAQNVTGNATVSWPSAHQADDIGVLVVETANQTVSTPAGWTLIGSVGTGTAGAAGSVALWLFWKRAASGAETDVVVTDAGDHMRCRIFTFRGCETSGSPIEGTPVTGTVATAATAVSIANPTTTVDECLVVSMVGNATDTTSNQTTAASWANSGLVGFARIINGNTTAGVGGGYDAGAGEKATAGAVGNSTTTLATASAQAKISFALKPPQGAPPPTNVTNGGIYVATGTKASAGAVSATTATLDTAAVQARLTFTLKTATPAVNQPPVIVGVPAVVGAVGVPVLFPLSVSDPEGDAITMVMAARNTEVPTGAEILQDEASGNYSFSWTPTADQAGEWNFFIQANTAGASAFIIVTITIVGEPDTTLFSLATALADRMAVDLASARALADALDLNEQMNAKVIHQVRTLLSELGDTQTYVQGVIDALETEEEA